MSIITTLKISDYSINIKEALRYMGASQKDDARLLSLTEGIAAELKALCRPLACYSEFRLKMDGDFLDFDFAKIKSHALAKNLAGCEKVILFAATLGADFDRLLQRKQLTSPAEALILDAVGSAAIEGVCDRFEEMIAKKSPTSFKPRFSPGYGDLDISLQKSIAEILKTKQNIGLTLNDSLMMLPTKSVTAFLGSGVIL